MYTDKNESKSNQTKIFFYLVQELLTWFSMQTRYQSASFAPQFLSSVPVLVQG